MEFLVKKIFTHLQNYRGRNENFVTLKRKLEDLIDLKKEKELLKSTELLRPRKKLKKSVEIWFQNVERITKEILKDLENEVKENNVLSSVGEKVLQRILEVDELLQQSTSFDDLVIDDPQWIGQVLSTTALVGDVPKKLMEEIWKYLMDNKVSKIGVWGMGGVGKTTIMKLINNQLLKQTNMFNKVIWITVSKEFNITKLQNDIVRELKVSLFEDDDNETTRAGKLFELLTNLAIEGNYVLILDDLWANLSLEEVGIPEPSNGSKLVVTTRSLHVCHYLKCQKVNIPCLQQPDAWHLFLENVGQDILNYPDLLPVVKSVSDECDGLPLAIAVIASGMRGERDVTNWRNALYELKDHVKSVDGMEEKIFQQLQFSYDRLGDEKLKLCFLCCALYPEDYIIQTKELISLWIAEGYVGEMNSIQAEIDRGHAILNKLKNNCLIEDVLFLLDSVVNPRVKMHDIVRDMALRITSVRPQFLVRAGMQLKKIPDVKEWKEGLEKVSLMENYELRIPSQMLPPNCPMLTTLLLSDCGIESIPTCFFEKMHELKTLDLSRNPIKSLPNSISDLKRLTTLLLYRCRNLEEIPSVSKLQALKKLDIWGSGVKKFPSGMDELKNLRYLCSEPQMDFGILSNLTSLLQLQINERLGESGSCGRIGNELLIQLEFLEINFDGLEEFNSYTQALEDEREEEGPPHYQITVGNYNYSNSLGERGIQFENIVICVENIKLPSNVETLAFMNIEINRREDEVFLSNLITCCGNTRFSNLKRIYFYFNKHYSGMNIKKLFSLDWAMHNLQKLEELYIQNYDFAKPGLDLKEIIGSESDNEEVIKYCTLPRLKILKLRYLLELKSICSAKVSLVCDSIEEIEIVNCPKLKRIPLIFPLGDDGLPSPPPSLRCMKVESKEWWKSTEWDQPQAMCAVHQFLCYEGDFDFDFGFAEDKSMVEHLKVSSTMTK